MEESSRALLEALTAVGIFHGADTDRLSIEEKSQCALRDSN
jgi:hypothetical protein